MFEETYQPKRYYVTDLYLVAWLVEKGQPILEVELTRTTNRALFWFPATGDVYTLCHTYRDGNATGSINEYRTAHRQVVHLLGEARRAAHEAEVR